MHHGISLAEEAGMDKPLCVNKVDPVCGMALTLIEDVETSTFEEDVWVLQQRVQGDVRGRSEEVHREPGCTQEHVGTRGVPREAGCTHRDAAAYEASPIT